MARRRLTQQDFDKFVREFPPDTKEKRRWYYKTEEESLIGPYYTVEDVAIALQRYLHQMGDC